MTSVLLFPDPTMTLPAFLLLQGDTDLRTVFMPHYSVEATQAQSLRIELMSMTGSSAAMTSLGLLPVNLHVQLSFAPATAMDGVRGETSLLMKMPIQQQRSHHLSHGSQRSMLFRPAELRNRKTLHHKPPIYLFSYLNMALTLTATCKQPYISLHAKCATITWRKVISRSRSRTS